MNESINVKHILTQVFVTLGVLFLILIICGVYFFVTDPLHIRPMLFGSTGSMNSTQKTMTTHTDATTETSTATPTTPSEDTFVLSDAQKQALITFGVDPAVVPKTISADQEACFVRVLGEARVREIKAGAVPSAIEFFKAKSCI